MIWNEILCLGDSLTFGARDSIMLVDLKIEPTHENHFCFKRELLEGMGFIFSKCLYDENKSNNYNAYLKLEDLQHETLF